MWIEQVFDTVPGMERTASASIAAADTTSAAGVSSATPGRPELFVGADALALAIRSAVLIPTAAALVEARRLLDVFAARVTEAEVDFVRDGGPVLDGAGSLATWLRHRSGLGDRDARRAGFRAERLARWPGVTEAWVGGRVDGPKVDTVVAMVPDRHVDRFALCDSEVMQLLDGLSAHESRLVLRRWVERADAELEAEAARAGVVLDDQVDRSELHLSRTYGDVAVLDAVLQPDDAALVEAALRVAERPDDEGERRTPAQRRAEALVAICSSWLGGQPGVGDIGRQRPHVNLVIDLPVLWSMTLRGAGVRTPEELDSWLDRHRASAVERAWFAEAFRASHGGGVTLDGRLLGEVASRVFGCDAVLSKVLMADGRVLEHGRAVRDFTSSQRQVVLVRDAGCRYPGCALGPRHCEVHHVVPWESGGRTDVRNAVSLCRHHHGVVHRPGWRAELSSDGVLDVHDPGGGVRASRPPGRGLEPVPGAPVEPVIRSGSAATVGVSV